jgi:hypothetical protein
MGKDQPGIHNAKQRDDDPQDEFIRLMPEGEKDENKPTYGGNGAAELEDRFSESIFALLFRV